MSNDTITAPGARKAFLWVARTISYLVYVYLIVVEIILFMGFFLLLFGANPSAGFTQWVYRNLDRVMDPFRGIFAPIELGTTGNDVPAVFETSVVFAMIMYGIVALVLSAFITWLTSRLQRLEMVEESLAQRQREQDEALQRVAALDATSPTPTVITVTQPTAGAPTAQTPTVTNPPTPPISG